MNEYQVITHSGKMTIVTGTDILFALVNAYSFYKYQEEISSIVFIKQNH